MSSRTIVDIQKTVLSQHAELRAGLRWLAMLSEGAKPGAPAERSLCSSLVQFAARFGAHLDYEDRELAPRIRELDAWGPIRAASLRAEHAAQRERLEFVCMRAAPFTSDEPAPENAGLAREVLRLVNDLVLDMKEEESWLARLAEIEEYGDTDQMTG